MQCPTVAYSGEIDKQKQAADIMDRFLKAEGLDLTHIIGPQTAHKIHRTALSRSSAAWPTSSRWVATARRLRCTSPPRRSATTGLTG